MAKPLTLAFGGQAVQLNLEKVDRSKLYGYVDTEAYDDSGKRCELGTLIGDGHSIVGKGGASIAYLSHDGRWQKKAELKPVDLQGKPIIPVKSSFDAPIELSKKVTVDEYLSHNVNSVYQLTADSTQSALLTELKKGTIFSFPFSYRGGLESSAGFILQAADGNIFLAIGSPTKVDFVGLKATAAVVSDVDEPAAAEEEDGLDFGLI
jgi:hypothetical protein